MLADVIADNSSPNPCLEAPPAINQPQNTASSSKASNFFLKDKLNHLL